VTEEMNISNSGLTSTAAIDLNDAASTSYASDAQNFLKTGGSSGGGSRNSVFVGVASTSTISLSKISVSAGGTACNFSNRTSLWNCRFDSPGSIVVLFANFTTPAKPSGVVDRKICYPSDVRVVSAVPANAGTLSETLTLTITPLSPVDYTMKINIIDEASTCPSGSTAASLVP
jgi:hypothetical protein